MRVAIAKEDIPSSTTVTRLTPDLWYSLESGTPVIVHMVNGDNGIGEFTARDDSYVTIYWPNEEHNAVYIAGTEVEALTVIPEDFA